MTAMRQQLLACLVLVLLAVLGRPAVAQDAQVHRLMTEVSQLLKPQAALREPALAARVMALI